MDSESCFLLEATPWKAFRFLDLPVEIRLLVYEILLVDDSRYFRLYQTEHYSHESSGSWTRLTISLLRVCKTISEEVLPIVYGQNTFAIPTFPLGCETMMALWRAAVGMIGMRNAGFIRRVFAITDWTFVERPGLVTKPSGNAEADIDLWYSSVGIQWEQLKSWVCMLEHWNRPKFWVCMLEGDARAAGELLVREETAFEEIDRNILDRIEFGLD
jgi:hypothetical protein